MAVTSISGQNGQHSQNGPHGPDGPAGPLGPDAPDGPSGLASRVIPMRERILQAASALFYAEGFRAVSAERVIALVGTTKVTFYRHFPSKDDLMVAYLERHADLERAVLGDVLSLAATDPEAGLRLALDALAAASCEPGYRGCAFINAAAEYADPAHPVRLVIDEHRRWLTDAFAQVLQHLGVAETVAADAATELMILRDGVTVGGYLGDPDSVSRAFSRAAASVIAAHLAPVV